MNNTFGKYVLTLVTAWNRLPIRASEAGYAIYENSSPETIHRRQWAQLSSLLSWAYQHSPYYRRLFDEGGIHPPDGINDQSFRTIPLLTKSLIQSHRDDILTRDGKRRLFKAKTSGSTGTPLLIYKDSICLASTYAAMYRGHRWHGVEAGMREGRLWGIPVSRTGRCKVRIQDFLLNRVR